jgi:hypothetical protein
MRQGVRCRKSFGVALAKLGDQGDGSYLADVQGRCSKEFGSFRSGCGYNSRIHPTGT